MPDATRWLLLFCSQFSWKEYNGTAMTKRGADGQPPWDTVCRVTPIIAESGGSG